MSNKKISVVVSVYNEEESLSNFYNTTVGVLEECAWDYELIFVNDGSADKSFLMLKGFAESNKKVKVVNFSRNFGHEAAMIAGVDYASGDGIVCMDADLQHPPESIPDIIEKFEQGYEVISMIRTENKDATFFGKIASSAFYKLLNLVSPIKFDANSSDFFAFSKQVGDVVRNDYREKIRYLRGYVQSVGFNKTTLKFVARKREAGQSKYNFRKLMRFALNTICSFSDMPLKLGLYSGLGVAVIGVIIMIYTIIAKFVCGAPAGYTTIVVALCFLFAVTLMIVGIIGQYIGILFAEIKDRPIYIVKEVLNHKEK